MDNRFFHEDIIFLKQTSFFSGRPCSLKYYRLAFLAGHRVALLPRHPGLHRPLHRGALLLVDVAGHRLLLSPAVLLVGGVALLSRHLLAILSETRQV